MSSKYADAFVISHLNVNQRRDPDELPVPAKTADQVGRSSPNIRAIAAWACARFRVEIG